MVKGPENVKPNVKTEVPPVEAATTSPEGVSKPEADANEQQAQRQMSKFESLLLKFPEPTKFTGKKTEQTVIEYDDAGAVKETNVVSTTEVSELTEQLQIYAGIIDSRKTSPRFDEQGEFMSALDVKKAFTSLLHEKGFAPATIFNVARQHIEPSLRLIQEYSRDIFANNDKLKALDTKNPFKKVLGDTSGLEKEVLSSEIQSLEHKRNDQQAAQIALMKHILLNPQEYGLIPNEQFKKERLQLSAADFIQRFEEGVPYAEMFTVGGRRMTPAQQKTLCKDVFETCDALKGADGEIARKLLLNDCIKPTIDRAYDVTKNDALSSEKKQEELDSCDTELAELMNMIVNQDGVAIYGSLIYTGEFPEVVTAEDVPMNFPYLRHREPLELKNQLKELKGEEHFYHRLQFHIDRVSKMSEDAILRVIEGFEANDKKLAQSIFSTEGVGTMFQYRRLALVKMILEHELSGVFDDSLFLDFHAAVTNDLFSRERDLIKEKRALSKTSDTYDAQVRGIERRLEKLNEELYVAVQKFLDEDNRFSALIEIQGESGGTLQLTFQSEESE